jgi:cell division protein FtsB
MKCLWGQGNRYLRITRRQADISPKLARIVLVGVLVLIAVVFFLSDVGLWNLWKAQKRINTLNMQINVLRQKNTALEEEIEKLKSEPFSIEKVARERYGYLNPGDRVYRIITLPPERENALTIPSSLDRSL